MGIRRTSLLTGLSYSVGGCFRFPSPSSSLSAIRIRTFLMQPSLLGYTTVTRARGHLHRMSSLLSFEMTTSPTARFRLGWTHFWRDCRVCKYSFFHLVQNSSAAYCTRRHHFREYTSSRWKTPGGGRTTLLFISRMWLGVSGSGAPGSFRLAVVSGLELMMASASVTNVLKASSSN